MISEVVEEGVRVELGQMTQRAMMLRCNTDENCEKAGALEDTLQVDEIALEELERTESNTPSMPSSLLYSPSPAFKWSNLFKSSPTTLSV